MSHPALSRRQFVQSITAAAVSAPLLARAASPGWTIGCFNRPWTKWSLDEALGGIKQAGYGVMGLLTPPKGEAFTGSAATPEYLAGLKQKIAAHGLKANMCSLRIKSGELADVIKDTRQQIANAATLGLEYALTFGTSKESEVEQYYKVMSDAAAYAQERGIKLVMKPHGGSSGSSQEIVDGLKRVKHPNFKIWYDAGNIIYYTGKDPVAELKPIAEHVTGFCAKDCAAPKSEVMIQFGTGKVDFPAVFATLKSAGFNGPIMVECCAIGPTAAETTANAAANLAFLKKVLAAV
jgi:sugar phosphate isomerase/epimerase